MLDLAHCSTARANDLWLHEDDGLLLLPAAGIARRHDGPERIDAYSGAIFSTLIAFGAAVALVPNVPLIQLLLGIQALNGVLLPIILVFLLLLINDQRLVGPLKNSRLYNALGWGTFALVTTAVAILLGSQLLGLFGIDLVGGG